MDPVPWELVAAAKSGDHAAMERLLRDHYDRVATLCRRLMGNPTDAEDCTQDALLALVRGLDRFDGRASFSTWAYRITTNVCLDELRRRGRRPVPADPDAMLPAVAVGDAASRVASRLDIDRALDTLSEEFRVAVVLRDLCGLDYAEIADRCGIPAGTVRSRIARARAALADQLDDGNQTGGTDVQPSGTDATDAMSTEP